MNRFFSLLCFIFNMPSRLLESVVSMLEVIFDAELGDPVFNAIVGVCCFTWVLIARVFMTMFPTKRGIFAVVLALALSLGLGLLGYSLTEIQMVPLVQTDWARGLLPWMGFGLSVLLSILLVARRILGVSTGVAVFIYIVATTAAVGAYFGAQVTIGLIEYGEEKVEQREQRVKEDLDSLLYLNL